MEENFNVRLKVITSYFGPCSSVKKAFIKKASISWKWWEKSPYRAIFIHKSSSLIEAIRVDRAKCFHLHVIFSRNFTS